jgi:hypothetical protein
MFGRTSRALTGATALFASVMLTGVSFPTAAQSAPPTKGLTKASTAIAMEVVAAVNRVNNPARPAKCFDVWVTKSDPNWATWTFSRAAYRTGSDCALVDAYAEFYNKTGRKWKWAGRFSGTDTPLCFFTVGVQPGLTVQRQLGCA